MGATWKKMEKGILKIICASQGAVDTDFLVCNLGSSVSEIISSSEKFVSCCPFGQQKVVARTRVQLCQTKGCLGSCRRLHVCKRFLLSGSCRPMLTRWEIHFEMREQSHSIYRHMYFWDRTLIFHSKGSELTRISGCLCKHTRVPTNISWMPF